MQTPFFDSDCLVPGILTCLLFRMLASYSLPCFDAPFPPLQSLGCTNSHRCGPWLTCKPYM
jgi:hypothetical protein